MHTFEKIKTKFDDISFISLIFVWFMILIFSTINEENHTLKQIVLKEELTINTKALNYFNWKEQNIENIVKFAKQFNDADDIKVVDKSWKTVFSLPEISKSDNDESLHGSAYWANLVDIKSWYDTKKWKILAINFDNSLATIIMTKQLTKQETNSIWIKHFSTLFIVLLIIAIIYTTYNTFVVKKIIIK